MSDDPKFCKDCKYANDVAHNGVRTICLHSQARMVGSAYEVTGEEKDRQHYECTAMRAGICKDGQLWERKDAPVFNMDPMPSISDLMYGKKI